jgi:hypothetical protein
VIDVAVVLLDRPSSLTSVMRVVAANPQQAQGQSDDNPSQNCLLFVAIRAA